MELAGKLRTEAEQLSAYVRAVREHVREQSDPFSGCGFTIDDQLLELSKLVLRTAAAVSRILVEIAVDVESR